MLKKIISTASFIQSKTDFRPSVGIILGSGLGSLADQIDVVFEMEYRDIPNFPVSTVEGHKGRLIMGTLSGVAVVAMQGRFHYYEGYSPAEVVFPVRVLHQLGISQLIVSNASGGLNPGFKVGDIMVITDHINMIPNPLVGPNIAELGTRFPDMSNAYDKLFIERVGEAARTLGVDLQYGCYVGVTGPSFETQSECRYFHKIGADVVGMSTTLEVIAAAHCGLPVLALSVVTNMALGGGASSHEDVQQQGAAAAVTMTALVSKYLETNY